MHPGEPSAGAVTCCPLLQCPPRSVRMLWWPLWTPTSTARHKRSPAPSTPSHRPPPCSGIGSWRRSAPSAPSECQLLVVFCSLCRSGGIFVLGWGLFGASPIQGHNWVQTQWPMKKKIVVVNLQIAAGRLCQDRCCWQRRGPPAERIQQCWHVAVVLSWRASWLAWGLKCSCLHALPLDPPVGCRPKTPSQTEEICCLC